MLEDKIFWWAMLLISFLFVFHGCVLLFVPDRYIPMYTWGESSLRLVRKPPFQFWKRVGGFCLSAGVLLFFTLPAIFQILGAKMGVVPKDDSTIAPGTMRWDMLGLSLLVMLGGYALLIRAERSVEMMFSADRSKLQDKLTRTLWTLYVQLAALSLLVWSLLPMSTFLKSFR
jgi:hypothetical protein